ncbi:hypothetical protein P7C70_g6630, partial [Phenoliferia sp. Uapishka_3]
MGTIQEDAEEVRPCPYFSSHALSSHLTQTPAFLQWQRLIGKRDPFSKSTKVFELTVSPLAEDEFVARLLNQKQELLQKASAVATGPAAAAPVAGNDSVGEDIVRQLDELKVYAEYIESAKSKQEGQIASLEAALDNEKSRCDSLEDALRRAKASSGGMSAAAESFKLPSAGPPYILVLIDGSSAPFNDGLVEQGASGGFQAASQIRWEVEKDIRVHDIPIDPDDEYGEAAEVVISSPATWESFTNAFNSGPLSHILDIGETPVETKFAALLKILSPTQTLKRIYLAGILPASLIVALPEIQHPDVNTGSQTRRRELNGTRVSDKIILINTKESTRENDALLKYQWRIVKFERFFSRIGDVEGEGDFSTGGDDDDWSVTRDRASEATRENGSGRSSESAKFGSGGGSGGGSDWKMMKGPKSRKRKADLTNGKVRPSAYLSLRTLGD